MFNIKIGTQMVVSYARSGKNKNGEPYAVIGFREKDNQGNIPEGYRKSESNAVCKVWYKTMPEGFSDGVVVQLDGFDGVNWLHTQHSYDGRTVYRDELELIGASFSFA